MRAIIRFSIDNEHNSALRNKLQAALRKHGFSNKKNTATYMGKGPKTDANTLKNALYAFWEKVYKNGKKPGRLDHFWMYVERQRRSPAKMTVKKISTGTSAALGRKKATGRKTA